MGEHCRELARGELSLHYQPQISMTDDHVTEPAHPLDDALWPDISATYDVFEVAVYRPIASGPEGT